MRRRDLMLAGGTAAAIGGAAMRRIWAELPGGDWVDASVNGMAYKVLPPQRRSEGLPVLLYLHQLDMGTYPDALLKQVNPWFNSAMFRSRHSCVVVMPLLDQSHDAGGVELNFGGKPHGHVGQENTLAALQRVLAAYPTDPRRVYVTGNSMGGMGTWDLLLNFNTLTGTKGQLFAAGMPVSGSHRTADPQQAAQTLRSVPIWAFHGARDREVSPDWDRQLARLLKPQRTFRYTEYPDLAHDVWDATYARGDVWEWLFKQRAA
jgi:predicted peptidase